MFGYATFNDGVADYFQIYILTECKNIEPCVHCHNKQLASYFCNTG